MKHSIQIGTLALAVAELAAGCTKDGKFNPSEKISSVYESFSTQSSFYDGEEWQSSTNETPRYKTEQWTWDGKKLASIAYYGMDGTEGGTAKFEYDGSQLSKITQDGSVTTFTYDGSKVESATIKYNGATFATIDFTHDGSKISEIKMTYNFGMLAGKASRSVALMEKALWQVVLPCDASGLVNRACAKAKAGGAKAGLTETIKLTWDGKNISKAEASTSTIAYTYDNKKNPYRGFLLALLSEGPGAYSKNNVLTEVQTDTEEGVTTTKTTTYTYTYDGNWPEKRTFTMSDSDDTYRSTSTVTQYFEYAD